MRPSDPDHEVNTRAVRLLSIAQEAIRCSVCLSYVRSRNERDAKRAQMIARGLTRGLTYPDIEKTCTREPDWYLARRYLHRYINSQGFVNYLNDDELKGKETLCVLYHQWRTSTELQRKKMPHNEYPFLRT